MKRQEPESIGDVMRRTIQAGGLGDRLNEPRAIALWPTIVGEEIASRTSRPSVTRGVMTIHVRNASLRQELNMSRSALIGIINDSLGKEIIKELYFR